MKTEIKSVAVFGLGAIGATYAQYIARNATDVQVFGCVRDLNHLWGAPLLINDDPLQINYRTIDTLESVPIQLLLLCVKSYQMKETIASIRSIVGENTTIISLVSGIGSEDLLCTAFGEQRVIPATLMGASIIRNDRYITVSQSGTLYYGPKTEEQAERVEAVRRFFSRCRIPSKQVNDIRYYQWAQMMLDISINQISAVYQLTYGKLLKSKQALETMHVVQMEVAAVADSCGVHLGKADLIQWGKTLETFPPEGCGTMLQDYWMNRKLETDAFGEYICALAEKNRVEVPANLWLCGELKALIRGRSEGPFKDTVVCGLSSRKNLQITPEKISNQLRLDIILAKIGQDDKLSENELANRFDVSRNSVRTALQMLTNEGFLQLLPNGRRKVMEFGGKQVEDLFDTRWLLENRAVEILMAEKQSVYPLLAEALLEMERKYRSHSENAEWPELDVGFHRSLIQSSDNMALHSAWESGAQMMYAMTVFNTVTQSDAHYSAELFGKHRYLYEMILSGDKTVFSELKRHIMEEKKIASAIVSSFRR